MGNAPATSPRASSALAEALVRGDFDEATRLAERGEGVDFVDAASRANVARVALEKRAPTRVLAAWIAAKPATLDHGVHGYTAVHYACQFNLPAHLALLLAAGASAVAKTQEGALPIDYACAEGADAAVLRALVDAGATAAHVARDGSPPLALLLRSGRATGEKVAALLRAGADAKRPLPDGSGWTPLLVATQNGADLGVVKTLVDVGGADVRVSVNGRLLGLVGGDTPVSLAKAKCGADVVAFLEERVRGGAPASPAPASPAPASPAPASPAPASPAAGTTKVGVGAAAATTTTTTSVGAGGGVVAAATATVAAAGAAATSKSEPESKAEPETKSETKPQTETETKAPTPTLERATPPTPIAKPNDPRRPSVLVAQLSATEQELARVKAEADALRARLQAESERVAEERSLRLAAEERLRSADSASHVSTEVPSEVGDEGGGGGGGGGGGAADARDETGDEAEAEAEAAPRGAMPAPRSPSASASGASRSPPRSRPAKRLTDSDEEDAGAAAGAGAGAGAGASAGAGSRTRTRTGTEPRDEDADFERV